MIRQINSDGLAHLKRWEGLRLSAYQDVAGVWTIGYGHTSAAGAPTVKAGMKISEAEAEQILRRDLNKFEARVERLVKVALNDNQFAALVSFDYNTGALHKSTLLKKLNAGDYDAVPGELSKWINAGGKRVQGLVNRRASEAGLWAKGAFVSTTGGAVKASSEIARIAKEYDAALRRDGYGVTPAAGVVAGAAAVAGVSSAAWFFNLPCSWLGWFC